MGREREREREREAQVFPMLLITSGVSTLLTTLGHAHLQGHEPASQRTFKRWFFKAAFLVPKRTFQTRVL